MTTAKPDSELRISKTEGKQALIKKKKRKLKRSEIKMKLADSIPRKDRWWSTWPCEASQTVASCVAEQLNMPSMFANLAGSVGTEERTKSITTICGVCKGSEIGTTTPQLTEEIWNSRNFVAMMKLWMINHKDASCVDPILFTK